MYNRFLETFSCCIVVEMKLKKSKKATPVERKRDEKQSAWQSTQENVGVSSPTDTRVKTTTLGHIGTEDARKGTFLSFRERERLIAQNVTFFAPQQPSSDGSITDLDSVTSFQAQLAMSLTSPKNEIIKIFCDYCFQRGFLPEDGGQSSVRASKQKYGVVRLFQMRLGLNEFQERVAIITFSIETMESGTATESSDEPSSSSSSSSDDSSSSIGSSDDTPFQTEAIAAGPPTPDPVPLEQSAFEQLKRRRRSADDGKKPRNKINNDKKKKTNNKGRRHSIDPTQSNTDITITTTTTTTTKKKQNNKTNSTKTSTKKQNSTRTKKKQNNKKHKTKDASLTEVLARRLVQSHKEKLTGDRSQVRIIIIF